MPGVELAPAVVVRVAGWPIGAVKGLGDAALTEAAVRASEGDAGCSDLTPRYTEALERARLRLWQRTAGDPRFMRALALVNPTLAVSLANKSFPARRNKAARHLETTLYRYLSRAVSRTEPCGLWTGATVARWSTRRRTRATGRISSRVAPDLSPFRRICQRLATRQPYADLGPYKLNPTLARQTDGAFLMWSGPGRGSPVQRRLGGGAATDRILATLGQRSVWTRSEATGTLVEHAGLETDAARRVVERFVETGVLVGGFAFPRRFRDPWDALRRVEAGLEPEHARAWHRARTQLASIAAQLSRLLDDGDIESIVDRSRAAGAVVEALARTLGIDDLVAPRTALRCDVAAPWEVQLGPQDARMLQQSIVEFSRYQDADGMHAPLLRASARRMLGAGPGLALAAVEPVAVPAADDGTVGWDAVLHGLGADQQLTARSDASRQRLALEQAEVSVTPRGRNTGPSLAALHVSVVDPSLGRGVLVHGLGLDATAAYARLADLLDEQDVDGDGLALWFRQQYRRVAEDTGADVAVLVYDHHVPNVMAQPDLGAEILDPWGVTPGQLPDRGLRLTLDPRQQPPLIEVDGRARPLVAFAPTAASTPHDDPCLQALLMSSSHVPPLVAPGARIVHDDERAAPRHCPRLRLEGGTVVRPRSTWLQGPHLEALTQVKGVARFVRWQQLATTHRWPALLLLERDGGPPLLVDRDSPLAIEAAFEGSRRARWLRVQEFVRDAWIGRDDDDADQRYVADLVLPFVRGLDAQRDGAVDDALDSAQCGPHTSAGLAAAQ